MGLGKDGVLWHADMFDQEAESWAGDVGRISLGAAKRVSISPTGGDLVLSREGQCHLVMQDIQDEIDVGGQEGGSEELTVLDLIDALVTIGVPNVEVPEETLK